ncbi:colicin-like pore-forming protein [Pseudomonas sp. KBS0710]|uniref:colicin-like pore-forming protein n=1 Tax=Pseudomonas sp. KBS0710 TaxID=1179667 RepID=UPI00211500CD|nr:colicin-like pore-forming protein [Pseudomonas sp. KBS0710]
MALEIGPIVITAGREQDFSIDGFGGGYGPPPVPGWTQSVNAEIVRRADELLFNGRVAADLSYTQRADAIPAQYQAQLTQIAAQAEASAATPLEQLANESASLSNAITQKAAEYQAQFTIALGYDGADPTTGFRMPPGSFPPEYYYSFAVDWLKAYNAGLDAKLSNSQAKILNDRKNQVDTEAVDIQLAIKFTADFYKEVGEKYGAHFAELAQQLASEAQGKTISNVDEAMRAFNQYKDSLNAKFNASDRLAIKNALDAVDAQQLANHITTLSKGFGYVGKAIDAVDLLTEVKNGFQTGEWNNTLLKIETLFAGAAATGLLAFAFGVAATTPIGILAFAMIMALTSAYISEARVKAFNDALDAAINPGQ